MCHSSALCAASGSGKVMGIVLGMGEVWYIGAIVLTKRFVSKPNLKMH